jgi:hypothetical protein
MTISQVGALDSLVTYLKKKSERDSDQSEGYPGARIPLRFDRSNSSRVAIWANLPSIAIDSSSSMHCQMRALHFILFSKELGVIREMNSCVPRIGYGRVLYWRSNDARLAAAIDAVIRGGVDFMRVNGEAKHA